MLSALAVLQRVEIVDCVLLWPSLASPAGKLDALYVLLEENSNLDNFVLKLNWIFMCNVCLRVLGATVDALWVSPVL